MRTLVLLPALLLAVAPAIARAEGSDPATAEVLFREGRRAAEAGDYAVACPKFEESQRLDPASGTLLSLADCEENRGQLARAWQHFRQLRDQLPATDERRPFADARARALEPRLPKLRILLASSSGRVTRDDVVLGRASLGMSLPVDPGRHVIVVTASGRRDSRYEVSLGEGDEKEILVAPGDAVPVPGPALTAARREWAAPLSDALARRGNAQRTTALVLGSVGLGSIAVGAILGGVALSNLTASNAACPGGVCANKIALYQLRTAESFAIASEVTLGVGLVLVGTAVVLALTAPRRPVPVWMGGRF